MNPLLLGPLAKGLVDIGKEFITDKDKQIEYAYKTQELFGSTVKSLLESRTTPTVDAAVKLLIALNSLWRPFGGFLMTCFGMYAHYKGMNIETATHAAIDMALPAWGVSRHIEKQNKIKRGDSNDYEDPRGWHD